MPYGLVFDRCRFTADAGAHNVSLARQWFAGALCSPYGKTAGRCRIVPGNGPSDAQTLPQSILETVGKMVVQRAWLGTHLRTQAPWDAWQQDRRAPNHRPAQFDSHGFWQNLLNAGIGPQQLGYRRAKKAEPSLAEWLNEGPGR